MPLVIIVSHIDYHYSSSIYVPTREVVFPLSFYEMDFIDFVCEIDKLGFAITLNDKAGVNTTCAYILKHSTWQLTTAVCTLNYLLLVAVWC